MTGVRVVAQASTGANAVALTKRHRVDVLLTDIHLPDLSIVELAKSLRTTTGYSPDRVVVMTSVFDDQQFAAALEAGVGGFLLKKVTETELGRAIHAVAAGQAFICPEMTRYLLDRLRGLSSLTMGRNGQGSIDALSARELDVLRSLAKGKSNREIAEEVHMSVATVKVHVSNVLSKLHLRNRVEAALYVYQQGLAQPL